MSMPGFTADASLRKSSIHYVGSSRIIRTNGNGNGVGPAIIFCKELTDDAGNTVGIECTFPGGEFGGGDGGGGFGGGGGFKNYVCLGRELYRCICPKGPAGIKCRDDCWKNAKCICCSECEP
jgi:hypothetical protein